MIARVNKGFLFSKHIKETIPFCASYTIASLSSSSLPCWPPNGCHICRLRETFWLSYAPVSRFLRVDLNPRSCESAIMHGHCFSDVSHLNSWEHFVMRQQWRPGNLSRSMAAPWGRDWSWLWTLCSSYQEFTIILQEWVVSGEQLPHADASESLYTDQL